MIKLEHLQKYYYKNKAKQIHVIDDISLSLPQTGLITFLGASGSGKTTLLNVIGGLDKADGIIHYDDLVFNHYKMNQIDQYRKNHIGYIFQNYNLINEKTVYENLELALDVIDINNKDEVKKRIEYCLKAVGMYQFRKKPANALSGGQMQRISIARALIKNSKIIIADEPTGNLDSANSIEIMNILKKISQKSLVLLVTHDSHLAEFYADQIIEIKDGKVIDIHTPLENVSLKLNQNDDKIYLKDLKKIEKKEQNLHYKLYLTEELKQNIELTIVQHNQQFYLQSNYPLKLVDNTPIQLIDDHYQEINKQKQQQQLEQFEYDTSWYQNEKTHTFFNRLKYFFKSSFQQFFKTRKRTKFFHIALILIGIILGCVNIAYVNFSTFQSYGYGYDKDTYGLVNQNKVIENLKNQKEYSNLVVEAYKKGYIENFYYGYQNMISIDYQMNPFKETTFTIDSVILYDQLIKDYPLLAGQMAKTDSEVVVGKEIADQILKHFNDKHASYKTLLNIQLNNYTIVGVTKKETRAIYKKEKIEHQNIFVAQNMMFHRKESPISIGYFPYEKNRYTIVYGNDLNQDNQTGLLYCLSQEELNLLNQEEIQQILNHPIILKKEGDSTQSKTFNVVGIALKTAGWKCPKYLINDLEFISKEEYNQYAFDKENASYQVVEGRDITNSFECLVSYYSSLNVGDILDGIPIVGKYILKNDNQYDFNYGMLSNALVDYKTLHFLNYLKYDEKNQFYSIHHTITYTSNHFEKLKQFFKKQGYEIDNFYEICRNIEKQNVVETKQLLIPLMLLLSAISLVYIYFTMKSKMLSEIYNIGVYRALGVSKKRMIFKYAIDILVTTLFTTFIGFISINIIFSFIMSQLSSSVMLTIDVFANGMTYFITFGLFIANILIGLIPIVSLMRKTPSQIIAKYDI